MTEKLKAGVWKEYRNELRNHSINLARERNEARDAIRNARLIGLTGLVSMGVGLGVSRFIGSRLPQGSTVEKITKAASLTALGGGGILVGGGIIGEYVGWKALKIIQEVALERVSTLMKEK